MKLSELKSTLQKSNLVNFSVKNGHDIPAHFHVTELGKVTRSSIDCGGKLHEDTSLILQLWVAADLQHRLTSEKFLKIIDHSERSLSLPDEQILVEYQGNTLESYSLDFSQGDFVLSPLKTECKAMDSCSPIGKEKLANTSLKTSSCCGSESQCC